MLEVKGKIVLILGLGAYEEGSGVSSALFCLKRGAKQVIVTDLKTEKELKGTLKQLKKYPNVKYTLGEHLLADVGRAHLIVKNPGVPENHKAVKFAKKLGKTITNDIGLFLAHKPEGGVIGVTGTRGKSTTTTLIFELLTSYFPRTFLGGNIGRSPLQFIDDLEEGDLTVLELSSWMLHDIRPMCDVAVVTNILPDHMNRYSSMDAYQKDKERIWKYQHQHQYVVLNCQNKQTAMMAKQARSQVVWFGAGKGSAAVVKRGKIYFQTEEIAPVKELKLLGEHNVENVLAAVAVAKLCGVPNTQIRGVLKKFKGVPNRLEQIRTFEGVKYYNDTTATTPDATIAALQSFKKKVILIAGGNTKGLSLKEMAKVIKKKAAILILLAGNANHSLRRTLPNGRITEVATMPEAVAIAHAHAKKGDIVLLSPGCSWLPVMNEFERGKQFVREVKKLK